MAHLLVVSSCQYTFELMRPDTRRSEALQRWTAYIAFFDLWRIWSEMLHHPTKQKLKTTDLVIPNPSAARFMEILSLRGQISSMNRKRVTRNNKTSGILQSAEMYEAKYYPRNHMRVVSMRGWGLKFASVVQVVGVQTNGKLRCAVNE